MSYLFILIVGCEIDKPLFCMVPLSLFIFQSIIHHKLIWFVNVSINYFSMSLLLYRTKLGNDDMSILTRRSCTALLYLYASELLDFFSERLENIFAL